MHLFATVEQCKLVSQQAPWLPTLSPCGKFPRDFSLAVALATARDEPPSSNIGLHEQALEPLKGRGKMPLEVSALH